MSSKVVDRFSLANIIQISSLDKKSHVMEISATDRSGSLYLQDGELIDAVTGDLCGEKAAIAILCWEKVEVEIFDPEPRKRTITSPLMKILLKASKEKDDRSTGNQGGASAQFRLAVQLAEAHRYTQAHDVLFTYLKANKKNATGWIWYSRIHGKLDVMEKALQIAHQLSPRDPLVVEEKKKFMAVRENLKGKRIRKCIFCWAPLDMHARHCSFCSGYLVFHRNLLQLGEKPAPAPFIDAVKRYLRVCETYPKAHVARYSLCLAYLNMGEFREALHHLDILTKQSGDKGGYIRQLNMLMEFIAGAGCEESAMPVPAAGVEGRDLQEGRVAEPMVSGESAKKVLVVEDSPTIRKVITIVLKRNGFEIFEAGDGLEALSCISRNRPDLILLDVVLPQMDGFKILSIIKNNRELSNIPIIMLTSKDGLINKVKGRLAGADAYLTKPFDPKEMIRVIEKHIH